MNAAAQAIRSAALQRCLNSPYLRVDESKRARVRDELAAAQRFLQQAETSFTEADEATGLKEAWATMFRAARALVYQAGYDVEQLRCMEVVLRVHYPEHITEDDVAVLRRAQELVGPPPAALDRARLFLQKVMGLL